MIRGVDNGAHYLSLLSFLSTIIAILALICSIPFPPITLHSLNYLSTIALLSFSYSFPSRSPFITRLIDPALSLASLSESDTDRDL